ncbi:MAG: hypothetical protein NZ937_00790 [Armatimonadetes bacterium]|nr:hypothetical protein [Armatimonadota bacterium]
MINPATVTKVLEEKMPENAWHSEKVNELKEFLKEAIKRFS